MHICCINCLSQRQDMTITNVLYLHTRHTYIHYLHLYVYREQCSGWLTHVHCQHSHLQGRCGVLINMTVFSLNEFTEFRIFLKPLLHTDIVNEILRPKSSVNKMLTVVVVGILTLIILRYSESSRKIDSETNTTAEKGQNRYINRRTACTYACTYVHW